MKYSLLNELQLSPDGRALKSSVKQRYQSQAHGTFSQKLGTTEGEKFIKNCIKENGIVYYSLTGDNKNIPYRLNVVFYVPYYTESKNKGPSPIRNNYLKIELSDFGTIRKLSGKSKSTKGQIVGRGGNVRMYSASKQLYEEKLALISDQFDIRKEDSEVLIKAQATGYWKDYFTGVELAELNISEDDIKNIQSSMNAPTSINPNNTSQMYSGQSMQRNVGQLVQWGNEIIMIPKELAEQFRGLYSNMVDGGKSTSGFVDLTVKNTPVYKRFIEALTYFNFACASSATKNKFKSFLEREKKIKVNNDFMNADMRRAGPFTEQLTSALLGIPNANDFAFQANTPFVDISDGTQGFSVKFSHSSLAANRTKSTTQPDPAVINIANASKIGLISGISSIEYSQRTKINKDSITIELNTNQIDFSIYLWNPQNPETSPDQISKFANSTGEFTTASFEKGVSKKAIKLGVIRLILPNSITVPLTKDKNDNLVFGKNGNMLTDIPDKQRHEMIGTILAKYKAILPEIKKFILQPTDKTDQEKRVTEVGRITRFLKVVNNMSINSSLSNKGDKQQEELINSIVEKNNYVLSNLLFEAENRVNLGSWKIFLGNSFNSLLQQNQTQSNKTLVFSLPSSTKTNASPSEKLHALSCLYFRLLIDNLADSAKAPRAFDQTEDLAAFILGGQNLNLQLPMANNFPFADVTSEWTSPKLFLKGRTAWSVKASSQQSPPTNYVVKDDFYLESLSNNIDNFGLLVINHQNNELRVRTYQIKIPSNTTNVNVGSNSTQVKKATLIIQVPSILECAQWFNIDVVELEKLGSPNVFKAKYGELFAQKQSLNIDMRTSSGALDITSVEAAQTLHNLLETNPSSKTVKAVVFLYKFVIDKLQNILTNSNDPYKDVKELMDKIETVYLSNIDGSGPSTAATIPDVVLGSQPQPDLDILLPANESIDLNRWKVLSGLK